MGENLVEEGIMLKELGEFVSMYNRLQRIGKKGGPHFTISKLIKYFVDYKTRGGNKAYVTLRTFFSYPVSFFRDNEGEYEEDYQDFLKYQKLFVKLMNRFVDPETTFFPQIVRAALRRVEVPSQRETPRELLYPNVWDSLIKISEEHGIEPSTLLLQTQKDYQAFLPRIKKAFDCIERKVNNVLKKCFLGGEYTSKFVTALLSKNKLISPTNPCPYAVSFGVALAMEHQEVKSQEHSTRNERGAIAFKEKSEGHEQVHGSSFCVQVPDRQYRLYPQYWVNRLRYEGTWPLGWQRACTRT